MAQTPRQLVVLPLVTKPKKSSQIAVYIQRRDAPPKNLQEDKYQLEEYDRFQQFAGAAGILSVFAMDLSKGGECENCEARRDGPFTIDVSPYMAKYGLKNSDDLAISIEAIEVESGESFELQGEDVTPVLRYSTDILSESVTAEEQDDEDPHTAFDRVKVQRFLEYYGYTRDEKHKRIPLKRPLRNSRESSTPEPLMV